jgi:hypothetical protein
MSNGALTHNAPTVFGNTLVTEITGERYRITIPSSATDDAVLLAATASEISLNTSIVTVSATPLTEGIPSRTWRVESSEAAGIVIVAVSSSDPGVLAIGRVSGNGTLVRSSLRGVQTRRIDSKVVSLTLPGVVTSGVLMVMAEAPNARIAAVEGEGKREWRVYTRGENAFTFAMFSAPCASPFQDSGNSVRANIVEVRETPWSCESMSKLLSSLGDAHLVACSACQAIRLPSVLNHALIDCYPPSSSRLSSAAHHCA